jgi:hypothetical protein
VASLLSDRCQQKYSNTSMLYFRLAAKPHFLTLNFLDLPLRGSLLFFGSRFVLLFLRFFLASFRAGLAFFFRRFCSASAFIRCFWAFFYQPFSSPFFHSFSPF